MRTLMLLGLLALPLSAQIDSLMLNVQGDYSDYYTEAGTPRHAVPTRYKVVSDDSTFTKEMTSHDGTWRDGYLCLNFGAYDIELTYIWYIKYEADEQWCELIGYSNELTSINFTAGR